MTQAQPAADRTGVQRVVAVAPEPHRPALRNDPQHPALAPHVFRVVELYAASARDENRGRPNAAHAGCAARLEAADDGRPAGEVDARALENADRSVYPGAQVAGRVARDDVPDAAVRVPGGDDRSRRITVRERERDTACQCDVVQVGRAARVAARYAVAVQIAEDGRGEGLRTVGRRARVLDRGAGGIRARRQVAEDLEERPRAADLIGDHLAGLREVAVPRVEEAAASPLPDQGGAVDADIAARGLQREAVDGRALHPEDQIGLRVPREGNIRRQREGGDEDCQRQEAAHGVPLSTSYAARGPAGLVHPPRDSSPVWPRDQKQPRGRVATPCSSATTCGPARGGIPRWELSLLGQRAGGQGAAAAGARSKSEAAPGRPARGTSRITASQAAPMVPIRPTAIACASGS